MVSLSSLAELNADSKGAAPRLIPAESLTRLGSFGVVAAGLMAILVVLL
jgi:hypothetical protein